MGAAEAEEAEIFLLLAKRVGIGLAAITIEART